MALAPAMMADTEGDDAPQLGIVRANVRIGRIVGGENGARPGHGKVLDGELAVQHGDHDVTGLGDDTAVNHEQVAVEDSGVLHGLALRPDEERRGWPSNQMMVQIEFALYVIVGRAREARRYA